LLAISESTLATDSEALTVRSFIAWSFAVKESKASSIGIPSRVKTVGWMFWRRT